MDWCNIGLHSPPWRKRVRRKARMNERGRNYFLYGHTGVVGWVGESSLSLICAIDRFQKRQGIRGGICEIGVHHGRFFIPLAILRRPEEHGLAIDVFDLQEFNVDQSGFGDLQTFLANLDNWSDRNKIFVHKQDSTKVKPEDILSMTNNDTVRLFSVDGSHTVGHTLNDVRLAASVLSPGGVIVLDDFLNPDWPGIIEATSKILSDEELGLSCICYGDNKLILVHKNYHDFYLNFIHNDLMPFAVRTKSVEMWGLPSYYIILNGPNYWLDIAGRRCVAWASLQNLAGKLNSNDWAQAEPIGQWTLGPTASLDLKIQQDGHPVLLGIEATTFFHNSRFKQSVSVRLGDVELGCKSVTDTCKWITFDMPYDMIFSDTVQVHLSIEDSRSPIEVGLPSDVRPLGIKVLRVALFDAV